MHISTNDINMEHQYMVSLGNDGGSSMRSFLLGHHHFSHRCMWDSQAAPLGACLKKCRLDQALVQISNSCGGWSIKYFQVLKELCCCCCCCCCCCLLFCLEFRIASAKIWVLVGCLYSSESYPRGNVPPSNSQISSLEQLPARNFEASRSHKPFHGQDTF